MAKAKRSKRSVREWFKAAVTLLGDARAILSPRRGCHRVVVELGEDIVEKITPEGHRILVANLGDRLILCGPDIGETCSAVIVRVEPDGYRERLHVVLEHGAIAATTAEVRVLRARRAETKRKPAVRSIATALREKESA